MAKVVFMGSPAFAVPSLKALHADGHQIIAVYTQPPRPAGRGMSETRTAVHEEAEDLGLKVFHPEKLRGDDLEAVMALDADVFCVVAYGLLLPKCMVDEKLCLNVHPSRLPEWRGAAPLQWTIMSGAKDTDICVMKLDAGMDTGPVVARERVQIPANMTLGELHDLTAARGADMLADVVQDLAGIVLTEQVGEATLAGKISKEMRAIDWSLNANEVHNHVRGMSPAPCATAKLGDEVFKIYRTETMPLFQHKTVGEPGEVIGTNSNEIAVACGKGAIKIIEMQRAGSKAGAAGDVLRGWSAMVRGAQLS